MPEHLRALVVIVVLYAFAYTLWRRSLPDDGSQVLSMHARGWLIVTGVAFLSQGFWTYIIVAGVACYWLGRRDARPIALYVVLLFAVPSYEKQIPGLGPIDHLFSIGHVRLLNIVLLLPVCLSHLKQKGDERVGLRRVADQGVLSFLLFIVVTHLLNDSVTSALRTAFYLAVDIALPYFAFSRALKDRQSVLVLLQSFVFVTLILGLVSVFELTRHWLLYESLRLPFGVPGDPWVYLSRSGGPLRAKASAQNPIALGYVLLVGLIFLYALTPIVRSNWRFVVGFTILIGGMAATISRGPWVGAASAVMVLAFLHPRSLSATGKLVLAACGVSLALLVSPFGDTVYRYLPFVGDVEAGNISYRAELIEVAIDVMRDHPFFGNIFSLADPRLQALRQGQGIIDIVNTYLQIALPYGLIGLGLFLSILVLAIMETNRARLESSSFEERLPRALVATLVGTAITIGTVSSITVIPTVYWMLIGVAFSGGLVRSPPQTPLLRDSRRSIG